MPAAENLTTRSVRTPTQLPDAPQPSPDAPPSSPDASQSSPDAPPPSSPDAPPDAPLPPPPAPPPEHTVHWFRKGLRLHDNPSLKESLVNAATFRCVFVIDPWFATSSNVGVNKWRFLLQCLDDLDKSLRKLGSRLFVIRGQPTDVLPTLLREWGTTTLSFEEDPEPYGRLRDHNITNRCRDVGIKCISRVSHTLYKLDEIIELNGGKAPLTYHQFQALIAGMPPPPLPEPTITLKTLNGAISPVSENHDDSFSVPTMGELGFEPDYPPPPVWLGGETEALTRLECHLERKAWVASYGLPKMTPQSLLASKTGLSPYLRFGCLSTRLFYYKLSELYVRIRRVQPPLSLHGQILWREFFYCAATRNPNFDHMAGNPICVQIPWEKNALSLDKWTNAQTGFPWIDAIMIQLREEGWIHHLARHAVACFLTRGDLWISWEEGMKVFEELLLDADWSVNAGMWMWLSCSSFFQQFFHCYCPVGFGRKMDPNGDFIRRYIPALRNIPTRYIHEPWVAPQYIQVAADCIIGRDYPKPMVNHSTVAQININRIKQVYIELAKYKPGSLNPTEAQSHSESESRFSPSSVIASINKFNYLQSQVIDSRTSSPIIPPKDSDIFLQPTSYSVRRARRLAQYKKKPDILHKVDKTIAATPQKNITSNIYNIHQSHSSMPTPQESYELKDCAINNWVEKHASQNVYNQVLLSQPDLDSECKQSLNIKKLPRNSHNRIIPQMHTSRLLASSSAVYSDSKKNKGNAKKINNESTSENVDSL